MSEDAAGSIGVVGLRRMVGNLAGQVTHRWLMATDRLLGGTDRALNTDEHLHERQGYEWRGNAAGGSSQPGADPAKGTQQTSPAAGTCSAAPDSG